MELELICGWSSPPEWEKPDPEDRKVIAVLGDKRKNVADKIECLNQAAGVASKEQFMAARCCSCLLILTTIGIMLVIVQIFQQDHSSSPSPPPSYTYPRLLQQHAPTPRVDATAILSPDGIALVDVSAFCLR